MYLNAESLLGSLSIGLAAAFGGYACRGVLAAGFDAVERNLAEKLRRLRASTPRLRRTWSCGWR